MSTNRLTNSPNNAAQIRARQNVNTQQADDVTSTQQVTVDDDKKPSLPADGVTAQTVHQGALHAPSTETMQSGMNARLQVAMNAPEAVSADKTAGPDGPARPAVAQLLTTYDAPRLGRPRERILQWAAKVQDLVTDAVKDGKGPEGVVDVMLSKDIRRQVFLLEGVLKFYQKPYGDGIRGQKEVAKELEDQLGAVKGARDYAQTGKDANVPAGVQKVLDQAVADTKKDLVSLVESKWMPDDKGQIPAIKDLIDTLQATPWQSYDDDKQTIRSELSRRIKKIEKVPYDMNELQGDVGIHELRRNLRWVPIYVEALDGAVQLDETRNPVKSYKKNLDTDFASSKFMNLPDAGHEADPIHISKSLYVANMDLVLKFGGLKDGGESIEELAHAAMKAGLTDDLHEGEKMAQQWLGEPDTAFADVMSNSQKLFDEMSDKKLLKNMRKDVLAD